MFQIRNDGDTPLEITRIQPACGCTAAVIDSPAIAPGQTGQLKATFDTTGFQGAKVKTIRVFTNDPDRATLVFTLQGIVENDVTLEPNRLSFGEVAQGNEAHGQIQVRVRGDVKITEVQSRSKHLTVTHVGGNEVSAKLEPTAPKGIYRGRFVIRTTSKRNPVLSIPVMASVTGLFRVVPADVSFGLVEAPLVAPVEQTVEIDIPGSEAVELTGFEAENPALRINLENITPGRHYRLHVQLMPGASGMIRDKIRVTTSAPQEPELIIPVYAVASRKGE